MNKSLMLVAALALTLPGTAFAGGAGAPLTGANAQVQAATPAAVAAALREAGYKVTMKPTNPDEDPTMSVVAGGYTMDVWLSGCKNGSCARVTASTGWDYSDKKDALDLKAVNEWNGNYYSQAYVYESSYYLDYTLPIKGGFTKVGLKAWMTDYLSDLKDFEGNLP